MANNEKPVTTTTNAVKKETNTKLSFGKRVGKWWREMKSELKKVIWPTPKTLRNNVFISVGMMLASAIVIGAFDKLATMLVQALLRLVG